MTTYTQRVLVLKSEDKWRIIGTEEVDLTPDQMCAMHVDPTYEAMTKFGLVRAVVATFNVD